MQPKQIVSSLLSLSLSFLSFASPSPHIFPLPSLSLSHPYPSLHRTCHPFIFHHSTFLSSNGCLLIFWQLNSRLCLFFYCHCHFVNVFSVLFFRGWCSHLCHPWNVVGRLHTACVLSYLMGLVMIMDSCLYLKDSFESRWTYFFGFAENAT